MGYFDGFTANLFRERRDGQRVIAPFGSLGRIYTVVTNADAIRISTAVRRMYQMMLVSIIGVQTALG